MRILVIRNEPPWPLCYGGRLHSYELCRRLAGRHDLRMLVEGGSIEDAAGLPFDCRVWKDEPARSQSGGAIGRWEDYFGVRPGFMQAVLEAVDAWQPDIVLGMSYRSLSCLARIRRAPTIWDLEDDEILHRLRELRAGRLTSKWADIRSLIATWLYQAPLAGRVNAVTVLSETDRRWFVRCTRHPLVECQPHGVDCRYYFPLDMPVDDNRIIFWGGLTFAPNLSAVLFFAEKVWPLVLRDRPRMRWSIIGWGEAPQLERLREVPGIDLLGYVKDIRPRAAEAAASVVPMVSGGGIKNKIMEAWAMARPVVCTPMALGDLPGVHGRNVWIAGHPRELADAVLRLASDAELRRRLGWAGRRTALEACSWDRAAERLESLCRRLAARAVSGADDPASPASHSVVHEEAAVHAAS